MARMKTKAGWKGNTRDLEVTVPDGEPAPWGADAVLKTVGTDVERIDAPAKVTGQARYTYDVNLPGLLVAKILHAPFGGATITKLDVSKARRMPGVRGLFIIKGSAGPAAAKGDEAPAAGEKKRREENGATPADVVGRRVFHHGEEILAIAADTEDEAEHAVRAVEITYDKGKAVTTVDAALAKDAAPVFAGIANLKTSPASGDDKKARAAIAGAPVILEATYETARPTHSSLETHGIVAAYRKDGSLEVWASTQATFGVKGGAVEASGLPDDKVHVKAEYVGGGFGSKFTLGVPGKIAIALARQTRRPVKVMLTREGEHTTGGNRPSSRQTMRAGVGRDGKIRGAIVQTWGSSGVAEGGAGAANPAIYRFGDTAKTEHHVFTNAPPSCAFRAPGHPQGIFAVESFMDELAEALKIDALELRRRNIDNEVYLAQWELGAREIGWAERRNRTPGKPGSKGPVKRGVGMASSVWFQGGQGGYEAEIAITPAGVVEVRNGTQDIGTGTKTMMAVLVAEELALPPRRIKVRVGDTRLPKGPASGGSNTGPSIGPSTRNAAVKARDALFAAISPRLGVPAGQMQLVDGAVVAGDRRLAFADACKLLPAAGIVVRAARGKSYEQYQKKVAGCQFAEVAVDTELGEVKVLKIVTVQDAGRVIARTMFESQMIGGVLQGVSYALYEQQLLDHRTGTQLNADLLNYKIAGPMEAPEIVAIPFDVANGGNSCGMMGLGEPAIVPTAAAIANAVHNAIGVRIRSLPITPDKVLAALEGSSR